MHIVEGYAFKPLSFELLHGEEVALACPKRCAAFELPVKGLRSDMQHIAQVASRGLWGTQYMQTWEDTFPADADGFHAMDLLQPAPNSLKRYGTLALLNEMAYVAMTNLNQRRQSAIEAGRWWPAPSQVLVGYGNDLRVSLVFHSNQQHKVLHWFWK